MGIGMFAFLLGVMMSFVSPPAHAPAILSLPYGTQSLDFSPPVPNNTMEYEDVSCAKSEWDMISVALAMYKLYWIESQQKDADAHTSKRRRIEVMPTRSAPSRHILATAATFSATEVETGRNMNKSKLNLFSEQTTVRDPFRTPCPPPSMSLRYRKQELS
jgi:hypothetical protein